MTPYQEIEHHMQRITHLNWLESLGNWDEAVMMPKGGNDARAQSLSTLSGFIHELQTSEKLKELIERAKEQTLDDPWQQANLDLIDYHYKKATCLNPKLVIQSRAASIKAEQAWRVMRADNNWQAFWPILENAFHHVKEIADHQAQVLGCDSYDAALDQFNRGINQRMIDPLFSKLQTVLPDYVKQISEKQKQQPLLEIKGPFPINSQRAISRHLMELLQFDFDHGRLDESHHPFCGGTPQDVRATTRYCEDEFIQAAMAVCHETGHAKYEQQLPKNWLSQPVGQSHNMAIHESQSLFVEMQLCRTHEFYQYIAPILSEHLGHQAGLTADNLYAICNRVQPGLIRVDADELTYPLHVIMRYEIEKKLFQGALTIKELPDAWHDYMQRFLGLDTKGNDKDGVMQDVHWPSGAFGYFPAYSLGSLLAAQLFAHCKQDIPNIKQHIATGDFSAIFSWLKEKIHSQGQLRSWNKTIEHATGEPLSAEYFLGHIKNKYQIT